MPSTMLLMTTGGLRRPALAHSRWRARRNLLVCPIVIDSGRMRKRKRRSGSMLSEEDAMSMKSPTQVEKAGEDCSAVLV